MRSAYTGPRATRREEERERGRDPQREHRTSELRRAPGPDRCPGRVLLGAVGGRRPARVPQPAHDGGGPARDPVGGGRADFLAGPGPLAAGPAALWPAAGSA